MSNSLNIDDVTVNTTLNVDGYVINPSASATGNYLAYDGYAYVPTNAVSEITTNATLTGGPIYTTGTLGINLSNANTWLAEQSMPSINVDGLTTTANLNIYGHISTTGTIVTAQALSSLGSAGSVAVFTGSSDQCGLFYLAPSGIGISTGDLATITFSTAYTTAPSVFLTPANATAAQLNTIYVDAGKTTLSLFTLTSVTTTPSSGTAIKYNYLVIQGPPVG